MHLYKIINKLIIKNICKKVYLNKLCLVFPNDPSTNVVSDESVEQIMSTCSSLKETGK